LFDPGSGSQEHDYNGGILPSGLFWTLDVSRASLDFRMSDQRAALRLRDLTVIDTFQFFGPNDTPARVDMRVDWRATGRAAPRGLGATVEPTDPGAFLGELAPAISTATFSGEQIGFAFESTVATTAAGGYAQIGRHRNGVHL
jgi:hypothetical protein